MLTADDLLQVMNEAFDRYDEEAMQTLDGRKLAIGRAVERAAYAAAIKACKEAQQGGQNYVFVAGCIECEAAIRNLMTQEQPK